MTPTSSFLKRFVLRFTKYSFVGLPTFLLDLAIIALLTSLLNVPYEIAVGIGFIIGISVNYHITYHWVFKGTKRRRVTGFVIFALLGLLGMVLITSGTKFFVEEFGMPLYVARTLIGAILGIIGFLINSWFNFKML